MKKTCMISIVVVSVLILSGLSLAGFNQSPFRPEINQLESAVNIINSANDRVVQMVVSPPEYGSSSPNLNGALNRAEAVYRQLESVNGFISDIVDSVMSVESPFDKDILPGLESVRDAARTAIDSIDHNPLQVGEVPDQFIYAVGDIRTAAQLIVDDTESYIVFINTD